MPNPYSSLPPESFWRTAVSERSIFDLRDLYRRKFPIGRSDRVATAGSCFAQHVSANLKRRGFNVVDAEPAPTFLGSKAAREQGYGIYSARYGNIYTVRQMVQLLADAANGTVRNEDFLLRDGRCIDLLRPNVTPNGFEDVDEAKSARLGHLRRVRSLFGGVDLMVFTLGLTEAWVHHGSGTVYPLCPDTLSDTDSGLYRFHNFTYGEVRDDLLGLRKTLKSMSPGVRMLLTVSPVPLTATASGRHVMLASSYSKSVLRAVCGEMEASFEDVDYFPSYEVITSPLSRGVFYDANLRTVNATGVNTAMSVFFGEHDAEQPAPVREVKTAPVRTAKLEEDEDDVICDEILLDAFTR